MTETAELRSINSGPIRRALDRLERKIDPDSIAAAHWNSSWGIVAVGSWAWGDGVTLPSATGGRLSNDLTFTTVAGRRYRVVAQIRVLGNAGSNGFQLLWRKNGNANGDTWSSINTTYGSIYAVCRFDGDGTTMTWRCDYTNQQNMAIYAGSNSTFHIEDDGPIVPVALAPPAGSPRVVASGNALGIVKVGALNAPNPVIGAGIWGNVTTSLAYTPAVGRRYRIVLNIRAINANNASTPIQFRLSTNVGVNLGACWWWSGGAFDGFTYHWEFDGDGASHSYDVQFMCPAQNLTVYTDSNGAWYLEDVGPNSSPALPLPETYPSWTPFTYVGSWLDYDASAWQRGGYRKLGDVVTLRGLLKNASSLSGRNTITTLPAGFRPVRTELNSAVVVIGASAYQTARLDVDSNGAVIYDAPATGTITYLSLRDISFSTTA